MPTNFFKKDAALETNEILSKHPQVRTPALSLSSTKMTFMKISFDILMMG